MIMAKTKVTNHSNTLILTDATLLHPKNASPLAETLDALKEFVKTQSILHGVHSCLQTLHFKSFRRIIMIFSVPKIADLVYEYLTKLGIKIGFARHDNGISSCDLDPECEVCEASKADAQLAILQPKDAPESYPVEDRCPGAGVYGIKYNKAGTFRKLEPPNPPIQMQSPPPSPYEGWIERPEEPPSSTTVGFHPKALGHLLYTYDDETANDQRERDSDDEMKMRRVFSSTIETAFSDPKKESAMDDLNIGEGLHDDDDDDDDDEASHVLNGSLFQKPTLIREVSDKAKLSKMKIPIVVVDTQEAENLRSHAAEIDSVKIGKV